MGYQILSMGLEHLESDIENEIGIGLYLIIKKKMPEHELKNAYIGIPNPTSIVLDKSSIRLTTVWQTEQLTATIEPTISDHSVTWSSDDTTVATVSTSWLVTCVTPWIATITATTSNGLTATCGVTYEVDRPDIDTFTQTASIYSWAYNLHAVWIWWDYVYLWRSSNNLSQCSATDGDLSNFNSSTINSLSYQSRWLRCKPDGTKLYNSHDNGNIYQITMNTAYSLNWATVSSNSMWLACCGISLSHDGTKLYHWVWGSPKIFYEYTLSTPRDVASRWTAISHTVDVIQSTSWDWSNVYQTQISPTWKKMYFSAVQWKIYQYNLATPYDWSTAVYYWVLDTWFGNRCTFQFKEDWTRIIMGNLWNHYLYQYDAS